MDPLLFLDPLLLNIEMLMSMQRVKLVAPSAQMIPLELYSDLVKNLSQSLLITTKSPYSLLEIPIVDLSVLLLVSLKITELSLRYMHKKKIY